MGQNNKLIDEAVKRGYKKGSIIHYHPEKQSETDILEGDYFEVDIKGNVLAFAKPENERLSFDDNRHDEIYNAESDQWVKLIK